MPASVPVPLLLPLPACVVPAAGAAGTVPASGPSGTPLELPPAAGESLPSRAPSSGTSVTPPVGAAAAPDTRGAPPAAPVAT